MVVEPSPTGMEPVPRSLAPDNALDAQKEISAFDDNDEGYDKIAHSAPASEPQWQPMVIE